MSQLALPGLGLDTYRQLDFGFKIAPSPLQVRYDRIDAPEEDKPILQRLRDQTIDPEIFNDPTLMLDTVCNWMTSDVSDIPPHIAQAMIYKIMDGWKERFQFVLVSAAWKKVERLGKLMGITEQLEEKLLDADRLKFMRTGDLLKSLKYVTESIDGTLSYLSDMIKKDDVAGLTDSLRMLAEGTFREKGTSKTHQLAPVDRNAVRTIARRLLDRFGDMDADGQVPR